MNTTAAKSWMEYILRNGLDTKGLLPAEAKEAVNDAITALTIIEMLSKALVNQTR